MKKSFLKGIASFLVLVSTVAVNAYTSKEIVVVVPSYNNELWAEKNISSILTQDYNNFRVIYIDDCSKDETSNIVMRVAKKLNKVHQLKLIKNKSNRGALYNLYHAIYSCKDSAIIVTVDGDDWLPDDQVLKKINNEYQNPNIWLTYGQFIDYPSMQVGWCSSYPEAVIESNGYRQSNMFNVSHLRTFYAGLFKKIKIQDLLYEGKFYPMTWDTAMLFPMLEISGGRFKFISDILYVYNNSNPISDHRKDHELQFKLFYDIKSKPVYESLKGKELHAFYQNIVRV